MFASQAKVSDAVMESVAQLKQKGHYTSWMDMTAPAWTRAAAADAPPTALPPLELRATPEDVRHAYPQPPAHLLAAGKATNNNNASTTAGVVSQKRGRPGPTAASSSSPQANNNNNNSSGSSPGQPHMEFVKDYETVDFLGRSFVEPTPALVQQAPLYLEKPCQPPRTLRGAFKCIGSSSSSGADGSSSNAANSSGIQLVHWAPADYGHLLFAANLSGEAFLWDSARKPIASYHAHKQPVKSLQVTKGVNTLSTASVDGTVALWDVEYGSSRGVLTNSEKLPAVQHLHHPSDEENLLLVALDRKVVLYDVRVSQSQYQREYTGHMGTVFNLTLLSNGSKMLTTAEDKTLRTWDFRIPVQIKQFADAGMHAITHVVHHPEEDLLAAQSLDNKIIVLKDEGAGKVKLLRRQEFTGHNIAGTRCQVAFSRDGKYISSGDISGGLFIWEWATGKLVRSFKAHSQMLVTHAWHPLEPTRVVTAGWDGAVKNWI